MHYRRTGNGPLLLMLHQSPQSSRELEPLMLQWAKHFTIVAPDSPGYGLSDPLHLVGATLKTFADASIEFMDAIGAERFAIYGFHTGGMIGTAIADGYPDRVTALACNGIAVPTDAELEDILRLYLPPFEPRWDAGHLAWLWAKTREQTVFFPWHNRTRAGRMDFPMPSPEHQQNSVLEFFRAGKHYLIAYRAAFVFHAENIVPRLKVPSLITAADWDPLQPHLQRLVVDPDRAPKVLVETSATPTEVLAKCLALLQAHPGGRAAEAPRTAAVPGRLWRQLVDIDQGILHVRRGGNPEAPVKVVLHGAGASGATLEAWVEPLAEHFHVVVFDLPGHGETAVQVKAHGPTVTDCAAMVHDGLDALGLGQVSLLGVEGGGAVAAELAQLYPQRVTAVTLQDARVYSEADKGLWRAQGMPTMQPEWSGGHLLRCWHMVRDGRLFAPWFRRDREGIRWCEPQLDDERIQLEVAEYLKAEGAWQALLASELEYPLQQQLTSLQVPVTIDYSAEYPGTRLTGLHKTP